MSSNNINITKASEPEHGNSDDEIEWLEKELAVEQKKAKLLALRKQKEELTALNESMSTSTSVALIPAPSTNSTGSVQSSLDNSSLLTLANVCGAASGTVATGSSASAELVQKKISDSDGRPHLVSSSKNIEFILSDGRPTKRMLDPLRIVDLLLTGELKVDSKHIFSELFHRSLRASRLGWDLNDTFSTGALYEELKDMALFKDALCSVKFLSLDYRLYEYSWLSLSHADPDGNISFKQQLDDVTDMKRCRLVTLLRGKQNSLAFVFGKQHLEVLSGFIKNVLSGEFRSENVPMLRDLFEMTMADFAWLMRKPTPPITDGHEAARLLMRLLSEIRVDDGIRTAWKEVGLPRVLVNLEQLRPTSAPIKDKPPVGDKDTDRRAAADKKRKKEGQNKKDGPPSKESKKDKPELPDTASIRKKPCVSYMATASTLFTTSTTVVECKRGNGCRFSHDDISSFTKLESLEALNVAPGRLSATEIEQLKVHINAKCT